MSRIEPTIALEGRVTPILAVSNALVRIGWRMPLLAAALVLGVIGRVAYSWHAPLWFDETFSAVIATQPTFDKLLHWCLTELTGPAFYMPLWAWVKLAGSSDLALRLPSLVLSLAGPLLILWKGNADRDLRLWWAVFALLWVPMFGLAGEARPYPQMFMLGTIQAMLFVRLLADPTMARATGWVAVSALLVLTQYWGAIPCLVQGIAYLGCRRMRAIATWPAALILLPVFAWAYFHLPAVFSITMPSDSPYAGLPLSAIAEVPAMLLGITFNGTIILGVIVGSIVWAWTLDRGRPWRLTPELALALCGGTGIAAILIFAFIRPGFAPRYLTPTMPSFLFGFALWARWMLARNAKPVLVVVAMMLSTASGLVLSILTEPDSDARHLFNLEQPSAWLAERRPVRLVVFWDGPLGAMAGADHIEEVSGFFLRRHGRPLAVSVARASPDQDPNRAVLALAGTDSAILWTANDRMAESRTPRVERYDPRFECRDFGGGQLTMTACRPRLR